VTTTPSTPPPRRYRWLARRTTATARKRHVFVEHGDLSLCEYASRYNAHEQWLPDAERPKCSKCEHELSVHKNLTEAAW
jgi:hypothetical protein